MRMIKNKRGQAYEEVIFILLNLVFFIILYIFVGQAGSGRVVYEEAYAKEIALVLDEAKPNMNIVVDLTEAVNIAKKNKMNLDEIVTISDKTNKVTVKLSSSGGYSYEFFTKAKISHSLNGNLLNIKVEALD